MTECLLNVFYSSSSVIGIPLGETKPLVPVAKLQQKEIYCSPLVNGGVVDHPQPNSESESDGEDKDSQESVAVEPAVITPSRIPEAPAKLPRSPGQAGPQGDPLSGNSSVSW